MGVTTKGWPLFLDGHPSCCPRAAEADCLGCRPGLHSRDTLSFSVWPNALSLLRWVQPIWWEREMGTEPLSFHRGLEEVDKRPSFEGHWESISYPKGKPGIRDLCSINRGRGRLFFSFFNKFIYLFWLCWVFVATHRLSLVAASGGYSSLRCAGFSLRWLLLLWSMGSRHVGFSSCGSWAE